MLGTIKHLIVPLLLFVLIVTSACSSQRENEQQETLNADVTFDFDDKVLKVERVNNWRFIDSNRINNYNDNLVLPNYVMNDSIILFNDINGNFVVLDLSTGQLVSRYDFTEDYRWKIGQQSRYSSIKNYHLYSSKLELLIFDSDYSVHFDIKRKFNDEYINELGLYPDSLKYSINHDSTVVFSELFCTKVHSLPERVHVIMDTCYLR